MSRQCGECQVCCTAMGVVALEKPAGTPCVHQCPAGCARYATRPTECASFECAWLQGFGEDGDRPDRLGALFYSARTNLTRRPITHLRTGEQTDSQKVRTQALVRRLTKTKVVLLLTADSRSILGGPEDELRKILTRIGEITEARKLLDVP